MYELYDMDLMKLIKVAEEESFIINKASEYLGDNIGSRLLILYNNEHYRTIETIGQYYDYVNEYNERLKQESCVQLKREILKI